MKRRHGSVAPSLMTIYGERFAGGGQGKVRWKDEGIICDSDARGGFGVVLPGRQGTVLEKNNLGWNPIVLFLCSSINS